MSIQIWVKLTGIMCIVCSSSVYGMLSASKIRGRQRAIQNCVYMLSTVKQQLVYTSASPIDIFLGIRHLSDIGGLDFIDLTLQENTKEVIFSDSFRKNVFNTKLPLSHEDKEIIAKLADILGCYDTDTQERYIELLISDLKQVLEKLAATCENDVKLTQTLSVLAGIFIAIVVI